MKQLYYTQCPIGYGLGASNGFQIKRLSPGYPISGDFRHLGLRAYVSGTRTMAPAALRYRRHEHGAAEVAWLQPRSHEYETERGFWGRPGGHFAHDLLFDDAELAALGNWPAGLFGQPFWTRSDRSPSRGEPPAPLDLTPADLVLPPTFEAFASLGQGEPVELLAGLLTALAIMVREGRTLFLIDEPERLASRISLLTLAFPPSWRPDLTFSTYHDRPEELPGFRLQGTMAAARPNRPALLSQGMVADLVAGTFEPRLEPAPWAFALAAWVSSRGDDDRRAWDATARRADLVRARRDRDTLWDRESLDLLYGFDHLTRIPASRPADRPAWAFLAAAVDWAGANGLDQELVPARPPAWWWGADVAVPESRDALNALLGLPSAWRAEGVASAWGETIAHVVRNDDRADRFRLVAHLLGAAPAEARPGFVRALVGALDAAAAADTLDWLKGQPTFDGALLLPLEVPGALEDVLGRRDPRRIRDVLDQAFDLPGALPAVLDALAAAAAARPSAFDAIAALLVRPLESARRQVVAEVFRWGLRQGADAPRWLGKYLHRVFADPTNHEAWRSIDKLVPRSRKPAFARVVLDVARDPTLVDEAYRWAVEEVLLVLPEEERPHDPAWPGAYLDRTPSGLDLLTRLSAREYRALGVGRWLDRARRREELTAEQAGRIGDCVRYFRALQAGDPRTLIDTRLPSVPPEDRGAMLAQILGHVGDGGGDPLNLVLDTCRHAWPGAFAAGQPGIDGLAAVLADRLVDVRAEPSAWFDLLVRLLDRLGVTDPPGAGFEPDSLAGEILAETARRPGPESQAWNLRQSLLQNDAAWRILAADARRDLAGPTIAERLDSLERWDRNLVKGLHTARFFEVWLNACDGPTLAATVAARALDLRSLGPLSWWVHARFDQARDDLRDAFARLAPMAPLPEDSLTAVQGWLRPARGNTPRNPQDDTAALAVDGPAPSDAVASDATGLSAAGSARWRCLEAVTAIYREGIGTESCWQGLAAWRKQLPLGELDLDDRYRFLAWFIRRIDDFQSFQIDPLAKWLAGCGVSDVDRIKQWAEELDGLSPVPDALRMARAKFVYDLRDELKKVLRDAREQVRKSGGNDSP